MPKYYVSCLDLEQVVTASDPVEACAIVAEKMGIITAGISWGVSEQGFNWHTDDEVVDDILIIRWLEEKYGNNGTN
tara:strand:- start:742 stop:969 length:228 start_codon:yes stop_codon:yes gene_type:complete